MKKVKVNYCQSWSGEGTHYTQTITLGKSFIKYINRLIKNYFSSDDELKTITENSIGFSRYYNCYLKEIDTSKNYCFLNITQLKFLYYYLSINNYDVKRILCRNTLLKIEEVKR